MAELDAQTATTLCEALSGTLGDELGTAVRCVDVSGENLRWDFEALDVITGDVLRRVSHTRTIGAARARAGAQLVNELWPHLEAELAKLGVTDCWICLGIRTLPFRKPERHALAALLALRIRDHVVRGTQLLVDRFESIRGGHFPDDDPITVCIRSLQIVRAPGLGTAKLGSATHDGLTCRVPDLHEELLPVVARERLTHAALASALTLLVEVALARISGEGLAEAIRRLELVHGGFCSVYAAQRQTPEAFTVARLY